MKRSFVLKLLVALSIVISVLIAAHVVKHLNSYSESVDEEHAAIHENVHIDLCSKSFDASSSSNTTRRIAHNYKDVLEYAESEEDFHTVSKEPKSEEFILMTITYSYTEVVGEYAEADYDYYENDDVDEADAETTAVATIEHEEHDEYSCVYSPDYFKVAGRIWWGDWSWTYYSEKVLPGYGLHIPGRYTDSHGYVRDEDGYLCLASDVLDKGTIVDTPFGSLGKVYDCGCGNDYTVDVYVGW